MLDSKAQISSGGLAPFRQIRSFGHPQRLLRLLLISLSSTLVLVSCGAPPPSAEVQQKSAAAPSSANASGEAADNTAQSSNRTEAPAARPQLIKNAQVSLTVKSVEESMKAVLDIVKQQQGDLLGFQDQKPTNDTTPHTISIQIRVPQERLDTTLTALAALGTVQNQSLAAEDVSNQLVDYQARLKNLRKSESVLLGIMERSGSVGDVLKVSQELSQVRETIERIDAQLTELKNQVAFSTIRVSLRDNLTAAPPQGALGTQIQDTWNRATRSLGQISVSLLKLTIWLLVYSPYWLTAVGLILLLRRRGRLAQASARVSHPGSNSVDGE